jgi:hypothetical protein
MTFSHRATRGGVLVINLSNQEGCCLTIPQSILFRADEVIQ